MSNDAVNWFRSHFSFWRYNDVSVFQQLASKIVMKTNSLIWQSDVNTEGKTIKVLESIHSLLTSTYFLNSHYIQVHCVSSCRDMCVFYAMHCWLYKKYIKKTSCRQYERWQKHKITWFDFVHTFAFENKYWFKILFSHKMYSIVTLSL